MPTQKSWDILKEINAHPRDSGVSIDVETHKYTISGESTGWISVSNIIGMFCSHFDASKAIEFLKRGKRWKEGTHPLCGKTDEEIAEFWSSENKSGTGVHARMEMLMNQRATATTTPVQPVAEIIVDEFVYQDKILWVNPDTKEVFDPDTNPDRVIGFLWNDEKVYRIPEEFSELGNAEIPLTIDIANREAMQIESFFLDHPHLEPYRSEWIVWDLEHKIAGTIDAVFRNKLTGKLCIYDWKRVASGLEVDMTAVKWGYRVKEDEWLPTLPDYIRNLLTPLEDIRDTKYWHYALQLNLYRYILEKNYGVLIDEMCLVQFHPTLDTYCLHQIPKMKDAVIRMIRHLEEKRRASRTSS
jgi:hypothetical protein